jgi:hypothetical protein
MLVVGDACAGGEAGCCGDGDGGSGSVSRETSEDYGGDDADSTHTMVSTSTWGVCALSVRVQLFCAVHLRAAARHAWLTVLHHVQPHLRLLFWKAAAALRQANFATIAGPAS